MKRLIAFFSLFGSISTLICCALPALFVSLGAGAAFASVLTRVPQLIWVSEHKNAVFLFAGIMLALSGYSQWRSRNDPCPIHVAQAKACSQARSLSLMVYFVSVAIFFAGVGFATLPELLSSR